MKEKVTCMISELITQVFFLQEIRRVMYLKIVSVQFSGIFYISSPQKNTCVIGSLV